MGTNISFVCRPSKVNKLGTAPIELSLNIDGKRTYVQLKLRCSPEDYKTAMAGEGCTHILEYVTACRKRLDELIVEYTKEGVPISAESLKRGFNRTSSELTLGDLFAEFLGMVEKRRRNDEITQDTYNRYVKTTKMFLEDSGLDETVPAKDVILQHLLKYQVSLNSRIDFATSANYLQKIKSIFKYGFETGKIPANPSYGLKINKGIKDEVQYLTPEELLMIRNKQFIPRLQEVADVFLFCCYTGLSFSDVSQLTPEDFKYDRGYTYVYKKRQKTEVYFLAVLFEEATAIAEKYSYRLPQKSNQRTNAYLKEIQTLCGIEKSLHFHMARHTAACYYINHRPALPNETIQRIFGWTDERQLRHYAKLFNGTVFDDLDKAFGTGNATAVKIEPVTEKAEISEDDDDLTAFRKMLGI